MIQGSDMIYFIRAVNSGTIKIGVSNDPKRRLDSMQTGSPEPLELLGVLPGGMDEEKRLHQKFARSRIHGEWFRADEHLMQGIEALLRKSIPDLIDESGSSIRAIRGEAYIPSAAAQGALKHDYVEILCIFRTLPCCLYPDPHVMLQIVYPGAKLGRVAEILNVTHKPDRWPEEPESLRKPLLRRDSNVLACDICQSDCFVAPGWNSVPEPTVAPAIPAPVVKFAAGDKVLHPQYGIGFVLAIDGSGPNQKGRISFTVGGEKTFVLERSPLRVVKPSASQEAAPAAPSEPLPPEPWRPAWLNPSKS